MSALLSLIMHIREYKYKILAFSALFFLILIQFKFLISTYEIRNSQYFFAEKELLNRRYRESIVNDYVYPGGKKIIDNILLTEIDTLSVLYRSDKINFKTYSDSLYKKIIYDLRNSSKGDTFFTSLVKGSLNDEQLLYCITLRDLSVTVDGVNYIALYPQDQNERSDVPINGSLDDFSKENEVSNISVSSPDPKTYRISYGLYVDHVSRRINLILQMLPIFFFSLVSVAMIIIIYVMIYQNWRKQKRLTMMTTDFLNSVTHEFNTPLASIIVANQSLKNLQIEDEKLQLIHAVIQRQSLRLQRLINQTISVTKLEEESVERSFYDIQDLLRQILYDYNINKTSEVDIRFDDQVRSSAQPILLNEFLFTTLVFNLLENAVKFNTNKKKRIDVVLKRLNNELQISISDNGIGISEKAKSKVFEQFYRESGELKKSGLGLGLFYVKKIVEFHKWRIKLNSTLGKGSEFIIIISRD
jgi:two-component system phosphate regulon sensor histidine kinase PhoR